MKRSTVISNLTLSCWREGRQRRLRAMLLGVGQLQHFEIMPTAPDELDTGWQAGGFEASRDSNGRTARQAGAGDARRESFGHRLDDVRIYRHLLPYLLVDPSEGLPRSLVQYFGRPHDIGGDQYDSRKQRPPVSYRL